MLLLVILSLQVCFSPSTMASFHCHRCWLFFRFFWFPHCPWVWPLIWIADYIWTTLLSNHIVAIYPPSEAFFWTRSLQWQLPRRWRPILQRHRTSIPYYCCWWTTRQTFSRVDNMMAPRWYCQKVGTPAGSGVHLVVAIAGQVFIHATTAWRQRHNPNQFLRTDKIIGSGRQWRKWSRLHRTIAVSPPTGATAPPRRWQDPTALHWQVQWLWIPCWMLYFEVSPSFLLTDECDCSFVLLLSFLTT